MLTRASVDSEWVGREWRHKVEHEAQAKRIAVVPVRGEPCEIPDFLAQRSYADVSGGSYPLGFKHLLTILRHYSDAAGVEISEYAAEPKESVQGIVPVVTPIGLEVGRDLIPLFEPNGAGVSRALDELAPALRDALRTEFGFPFPGICVLGNDTDMPSGCALILIEEVPELMFEIGGDDVLVDATVEGLAALRINSRPHVHPATGQTLARIAAADRAAAQSAGLTTWDAAEYLFLVLHAVLWRMASSFLDIDVTHHLVDSLEGMAPDRVNEIVPNIMSWFELTDVLQHLVDEEISIGDMRCILDVLSQRESKMIDTAALTERVRHAMCRQITAKFAPGRSSLPVFLLDPEIDVLVSRAIQRTAVGPYLALEPQLADDLLAAIRVQVRSLGLRAAGVPILVTAVEIRRFIRNLVSVEFPAVHVLSRQDLEPDTPIQAVDRISLGSAADDARLTNQGTSA